MSAERPLPVEALTAEAFAPFGDVIEAGPHRASFPINEGQAERYDALAEIDASAAGGQPCVSIVRVQPHSMPLRIAVLERHLLGSQAFVPLARQRFLVVVAPGGDAPEVDGMRCFMALGGQGVNYRRGTWHHPVIGIDAEADFFVVDRKAALVDCEVRSLGAAAATVDPDRW